MCPMFNGFSIGHIGHTSDILSQDVPDVMLDVSDVTPDVPDVYGIEPSDTSGKVPKCRPSLFLAMIKINITIY